MMQDSIKRDGPTTSGTPEDSWDLPPKRAVEIFSAVGVFLVTFLIRWAVAGDDVFERDGQPLLMLLVLSIPCLSFALISPLTLAGLTDQHRFALIALHAFAIVLWWVAFGEEWTDDYSATWESRFTWLGAIALPALAWYLRLGWSRRSTGEDP